MILVYFLHTASSKVCTFLFLPEVFKSWWGVNQVKLQDAIYWKRFATETFVVYTVVSYRYLYFRSCLWHCTFLAKYFFYSLNNSRNIMISQIQSRRWFKWPFPSVVWIVTSHPAGLRPTHVLLFHKHRSQPVCPSCAGIPADEAEGAPCAEAKRGKHRATGGGVVEEDHCRSATTVELHLAQIWVRPRCVCV